VILAELKAGGYRIVHVVPASADRPKTPTTAEAWLMKPRRKPQLPVVTIADVQNPDGAVLAKKTSVELCSLQRPTRKAPIKSAARGHRRSTHVAHARKAPAASDQGEAQ
jgi:hypothetical protein